MRSSGITMRPQGIIRSQRRTQIPTGGDFMRRRCLRTLVGAVCLIAVTAAPASAQQPDATPGGPWEQPNQNESLSAIRDYGELTSTLEQLVARSHGAAKLTYSPFRAKGSGRA